MCTCITFKTNDNYFGRTMDIEYDFGDNVVVTPRNYGFLLKEGGFFKTKYAMIGIAEVIDDYPLYAEATNEKGLSIAGLQFPDNAYYDKIEKEKINVTPYELVPWVLGNFASISELKDKLKDLNIVNINFSDKVPLTPLHWMISDDKDCIILEPMKDGINIYQNSIGVLTNNPPFSYHQTNINNYINLTPDTVNNHFSPKIELSPYGLGMGSIGLPGDNSPASRFVRAAFNKLNSVSDSDEESSVAQFFHILDTVKVVRGTTMTRDKKWNVTTYTCCINTRTGVYYYKSYNNSQLTAIRMTEENMNSYQLSIYPLEKKQQIKYLN